VNVSLPGGMVSPVDDELLLEQLVLELSKCDDEDADNRNCEKDIDNWIDNEPLPEGFIALQISMVSGKPCDQNDIGTCQYLSHIWVRVYISVSSNSLS
jgi:hypothetical protein